MAKVSILIPSYNAAPYLEATIQSALNQTWPDIEIIIVDDGSTDDSYNIALRYAGDKVKVVQQPNGGACRARNLAFDHSTGGYIVYLDADDLLAPENIEQQLRMAGSEKDTVVSSVWGRFYNTIEEASFDELPVYKDYATGMDMLVDMWMKRQMMSVSVWLTPRHIIEKAGPWNEQLVINQDGEFFCRVLLSAGAIRFCDKAKMYYRSGLQNSLTRKAPGHSKAASLLYSYELYEQEALAVENSERVKQALAVNYYSFMYEYYGVYPDLVKQARSRVKDWKVQVPVSLWGKNFNKLASLFGFYSTLKLRKALGK